MKKLIVLTILLNIFIVPIFSQINVTGKIVDANDNSPLIGVNVVEDGTQNGTISDYDGNFQLEVTNQNSVLVFSYLGYQTQKITVGDKTNFLVKMQINATELDEVVVIGYGTQKKSVVTGSISKVKSKDLENMPVTRIENSLQGRTSGVSVVSSSGQPGDGATVRIRGTTSINQSDPLYVVDGIPIEGGIDYLNQGDIESIEVLKDAASASIYGARSANGVILVTTKKGENEKMTVNLSTYYGIQNPWKKLALLNAREYATLMNESSVASGGKILFEDPNSYGDGTDWQDAVFHKNAPMMNHDLSISGGNKTSKYFASFAYFDQDGIVSKDKSNYKRFTTRFNSTHKINKFINFGNTFSYTRTKSVGVSTNSEWGSPLSRALNLDPITPLIETDPEVLNSSVFVNFPVVKDENGNPYGISKYVTSEILNPVAALAIQQGYGWSDKIVGNVFAEINLGDFKYKSSFGADLAFWGGEGFSPVYYLNATNRNDITRYNRSQNKGLRWILENTLSYTKSIGLHKINAIGGIVAEKNKGQGIGGSIQDIPVTSIEEASLSFPTTAESQTFYGFEYLNTLLSYLGRINYNYNEKYILSATMRVDGSSRFGTNNKFGYFPSVSIGWVLTEEDFVPKNDYVNFFKLRGSWGVNGSDRIGDFRYVSTVSGGRNYTFGKDETLTNGSSPNAIANPDLRWEQTTQTNFGFDSKLFKNFSLIFDIFEKKTTDMLLDIAVPGYVGNSGPVGNIATLSNKGIELELGYSNTFNNVVFNATGNISYNKNEITDLGPEKEFLTGQRFSPQALEITRTSVGEPIGYFYGYKTDGIFQNQSEIDAYVDSEGNLIQPDAKPGDFKFQDLNNNGIIDPEDRTKIGDPTPDWTYGINVSASWNNFDIVFFGQGVYGNEIFKATRRFDLQMANMTADALTRWTGEGTTNTYPRLVMNDPNKNFSRSSDFYVEDGSFFRIKNAQLGYSLPKVIAKKLGLTKLRAYFSANNLLTFTKYSGYDPEIGGGSYGVDRGIYPQPRFYLVGINAS
ncbi:MAG TPA: TonB-dependent receptor, partial [Bacteroidetes bacterium]|nr:TonB-dependent receptor [Bacteroidota bacterium]